MKTTLGWFSRRQVVGTQHSGEEMRCIMVIGNSWADSTRRTSCLASRSGEDDIPRGTFHGEDDIPRGTFHGEDDIPRGTFHGEDDIPRGTFH
jgi:hypothetical protein